MKILAIRLARLGDVVLLLPALSSLKEAFPGAHLTFLTGHRCAPVAELCPAIDEVIAVNRVAMRDGPIWSAVVNMAAVVRDIQRKGFDLVIDFHSFRETNLLAWLSGAPIRVGLKRQGAPYWRFCFNKPPVQEDKGLHVAAMFQRVIDRVVAPGQAASPKGRALVIPDHLKRWADGAAPKGPRLALYIDAPAPDRIWPPERFAAVAEVAMEKLQSTVIVLAGKTGEELARKLASASPHPSSLSIFTDVTIPQLAALISSARLLISNDTGPMHIGPAVGVQTLGLFSVGYPRHFRPSGPDVKFLRGNPIEEIEANDVIAEMRKMWITADRDLRC